MGQNEKSKQVEDMLGKIYGVVFGEGVPNEEELQATLNNYLKGSTGKGIPVELEGLVGMLPNMGNIPDILNKMMEQTGYGAEYMPTEEGNQSYGECVCGQCGEEDLGEQVASKLKLDKYKEHYNFSKVTGGLDIGHNVLIVGVSGAGKTTLAQELIGYLIHGDGEGAVMYDGIVDESTYEHVTGLAEQGKQIIATVQANNTGDAINKLIKYAGEEYLNYFGVIVEMNQQGTIGIRKVTEFMSY